MANPNEKQPIAGLTREDLLAIIEATRKPVKTEKEVRDEAQLAEDRKQMGQMLEVARRNKLETQASCSHKRKDGTTMCVYTSDPINKLYCQKCAAWIGPDKVAVFNEHMQLVD